MKRRSRRTTISGWIEFDSTGRRTITLAHEGKPIRLSVLWLHDIIFPAVACLRPTSVLDRLNEVVVLVEWAERKGLGVAVFLDKDAKEMQR